MRKNIGQLLLALMLFVLPTLRPALAAVEVGQPAPPLVVKQLDGQTFDLSALKGKVVILHFWATWCATCRAEMDVLSKFYEARHPDGLELIAISVERPYYEIRNTAKAMTSFVTYPAAFARDATVWNYDFPRQLPSSYLIDSSGIVRAIKIPDDLPVTKEGLAAFVDPWLKKNPHPSKP